MVKLFSVSISYFLIICPRVSIHHMCRIHEIYEVIKVAFVGSKFMKTVPSQMCVLKCPTPTLHINWLDFVDSLFANITLVLSIWFWMADEVCYSPWIHAEYGRVAWQVSIGWLLWKGSLVPVDNPPASDTEPFYVMPLSPFNPLEHIVL